MRSPLVGLSLGLGLLGACAFTPGTAHDKSSSGTTTTPPVTVKACATLCTDFPSTPIVAGGAASNAAGQFSGSGTAPAPCLTEPEDGSLFPNNWLRPRVKVSAPGATLLEIRFHTGMESNDLVVYTAEDNWALDENTWANLAAHVVGPSITVTVRTNGPAGLSAPSSASFSIAPAGAAGTMVYWALRGFDASNTSNTQLYGFSVGEESVTSVLTVPQIQETANGVQMGCIGCHTATPDGSYVGFTGNYPWPNALASVESDSVGAMPSFLGTAGGETLTTYWHGIISFSAGHWATGDHVGVTTLSAQAVDPNASLIWMELDSGATGTIARQGDPAGAAAPSFSHDGTQIVYTSTNANQDGRLGVGTADLYTVPYGDRAGGVAQPVSGASDPNYAEYYPSFSPDDQLIAFNRLSQDDANVTPTGEPYDGGMYFNPAAEVWVVPSAGGTATRLLANDPPACTPAVTPNPTVYPTKTGWDNSWAKWSPVVANVNGDKYYWLIFSSYRYDVSPTRGQLYMTAVVQPEAGPLATYPAIYVWNQDSTTSNHTPAWDTFKIGPID
ncbi:MAG TPA: hypothetical protein VHG72_23560 [Polyangia bacterium]|nr:hypothetical protein [Polyangia bacterium]